MRDFLWNNDWGVTILIIIPYVTLSLWALFS